MADVVAITRVVAPASTGDQDITTTDLDGLTPVGVLFLWNYAIADGSFAHGGYGMGAATGIANRWAYTARMRDGVGTSQCNRDATEVACIQLIDRTADVNDGLADFVTFIADGVRINWGNIPAIQHHIIAIFFAGDIEAHADSHQANSADLDITDPGFQPDFIIGGTNERLGFRTDAEFNIGMQDRATLTEGSWVYRQEDGQATTEIAGRTDPQTIGRVQADGDLIWTVRYDTFDANGMTARFDNGTGGGTDRAHYLAIRFPGSSVWTGDIDSPSATGDWVITDPGFTPGTVIILPTFHTAREIADENDKAGANGLGVFNVNDEFSMTAQSEDAVGTSNEQSTSDSKALTMPNADGTIGFVGSFKSFDALGWTLDFTAINGTIRKWFAFATTAGPAGSPAQGRVSFAEFEVPLNAQGQVSQAEFEAPDPDAQGQVSFAEFEVPLNAQGQVSFTEFEVPDAGQGQVSFAEFEVPQNSQGQVSQTEFEVPNPVAQGQVSFAEFQIPTQLVEPRGQITFTEFEVPNFTGFSAGQIGFAQFEIPDVITTDRPGQVSTAELIIPNVNTGGTQGASQLPFAEMEVPDAKSIQITELSLETPDPRRRGRVSFARVEFASVPGPNRQEKIVLANINRELFLEKLDVYGIKPDVAFFLPGFDPIDQDFPEQGTEGGQDQSQIDPQRVWTPKLEITTQFGETVQRGEMWLDYSFVLTEEDLFHILLVCNQHDPLKTTAAQDVEDQFFDDLAVLRDYATRCTRLTEEERFDCHCRLLRLVLRLSTETTIRRIQEDPFTDEPFDLDLSSLI